MRFYLNFLLALLIAVPAWAAAEPCRTVTPTSTLSIAGSLDGTTAVIGIGGIPVVSLAGEAPGTTTTFADLDAVASHSQAISIVDSLGASRTLHVYFFHTAPRTLLVRSFILSEFADNPVTVDGLPRLVESSSAGSDVVINFDLNGHRDPPGVGIDIEYDIPWNSGAANSSIGIDLSAIELDLAGGPTQLTWSEDSSSHFLVPEDLAVPDTDPSFDSVAIAGILNSGAPITPAASIPAITAPGVTPSSTTTYDDLNAIAAHSFGVFIRNPSGVDRPIRFYFFHTATNTYNVRAYIDSQDVDSPVIDEDLPRQLGTTTITFGAEGIRNNSPSPGGADFTSTIPWNTGSGTGVGFLFERLSSLDGPSQMCATNVHARVESTPTPLPSPTPTLSPTPLPDRDQDGYVDALDDCPDDATKVVTGICGCGSSDIDSDGDFVADCIDECPSDGEKIHSGVCGCGTKDDDANRNGAPDCQDPGPQSVPEAPRVTTRGTDVQIVLEEFVGTVTYELTLTRGNDRQTKTFTNNRVKLEKLQPGRWKLRYQVVVGRSQKSVKTRPSSTVAFIIGANSAQRR